MELCYSCTEKLKKKNALNFTLPAKSRSNLITIVTKTLNAPFTSIHCVNALMREKQKTKKNRKITKNSLSKRQREFIIAN